MKALLLCSLLLASAAVLARGGDFDATFGDGGIVAPSEYPGAMALQPDGTSIVSSGLPEPMLSRRLPDGRLDPSFGGMGRVALGTSFPVALQALAIQPDGKVVVAGSLVDSCRRLGVARLHHDGRIDTAFGSDGLWKSACHSGLGLVEAQVAVLASGRIMALGYPYVFHTDWTGSPIIARLTEAGAPDPAYGNGGIAAAPFGDPYDPPSARIFDDGSVEFVRYAPSAAGYTMWSSRLLPDGSIDALPDGSPEAPLAMAVPSGNLLRVTLLADRTRLIHVLDPGKADQILLGRFGRDHQPVADFGDGGKVILPITSSVQATEAVVTPDAGLLLVMGGNFALVSHGLVKLDERGRPDPAFGSGGRLDFTTGLGAAWPGPIQVQRDGYALIAGGIFSQSGPGDGYLARIQVIGDIVEFHNAPLNHFFLSIDDAEARGIDGGAAGPGWSRTGMGFRPGGSAPVCRFYGTPGIGPNSHFFTVDAEECERVKQDPGWTYEGLGFYVTAPTNGACAPPLRPVHRLYNNRWMHNDSNHRYVTDASLISAMTAGGMVHEGVAFCAKP